MIEQTPDVQVLPLDRFFVDHDHYQRPRTSLADEIGRAYDVVLAGVLMGSLRKKDVGKRSIALIDGQQRWEGAMLAKRESVVVAVYTGLSVADEAYVYAEIQRKRRQMTAQERVRAMVAAGDRFPAHVLIAQAVEEAGFSLGTKGEAKVRNTVIYAAAALERVYAWGSGANHRTLEGGEPEEGRLKLLEVLWVLREGFPEKPPGYVSADLILGMGNFLTREYDMAINLDRLVKKLQRTTPEKLRARANQLREGFAAGGSAAGYMANAILWVYSR